MIFVRVMAKMPLDGNVATILGTVCELCAQVFKVVSSTLFVVSVRSLGAQGDRRAICPCDSSATRTGKDRYFVSCCVGIVRLVMLFLVGCSRGRVCPEKLTSAHPETVHYQVQNSVAAFVAVAVSARGRRLEFRLGTRRFYRCL